MYEVKDVLDKLKIRYLDPKELVVRLVFSWPFVLSFVGLIAVSVGPLGYAAQAIGTTGSAAWALSIGLAELVCSFYIIGRCFRNWDRRGREITSDDYDILRMLMAKYSYFSDAVHTELKEEPRLALLGVHVAHILRRHEQYIKQWEATNERIGPVTARNKFLEGLQG